MVTITKAPGNVRYAGKNSAVIAETLTATECAGTAGMRRRIAMIDYRPFQSLIYRYKAGMIKRGLFVIEWKSEQKRQGITPQQGRFIRP
jgi:hypothetical protein